MRVSVSRPRVSVLLALVMACGDGAAGPSTSPINAADVAAVQAVVTAVQAVVADPAVASLRGVTVPYQSTVPALLVGWTAAPRHTVQRVGRAGSPMALLGEAVIPTRFLGGTYARLAGAFVRDPLRPGAPANGVRVLLYHRVSGVSTDSGVGMLELADSLRTADHRVTTAVAVALDGTRVLAVRSEAELIGPVSNRALHDVIDGLVGRGVTPIAVLDSFVIDSLSPIAGRNVVVTRVPALGAQVLRATPARIGASNSSMRVEVTAGGRRVSLEGSRSFVTGAHVLAVYVNGIDVARVDTGLLDRLGAQATSPSGGTLSQPLRAWLDAVGQLLLVLPAAAELSEAASNLLLALP